MVWFGMGYDMYCDVVWCGVVWCGVVWCGVVWCGVCTSTHTAQNIVMILYRTMSCNAAVRNTATPEN